MKFRELPEEMKSALANSADEKYKHSIHYSEYDKKNIYPLAFEFGYEDAWDVYSSDITKMTDKGRDLIADYSKGLFEKDIEEWEKANPLQVRDVFILGYTHGYQTCWNSFMQKSDEAIKDYNEKIIEIDPEQEEELKRMWRLLRISHQ